MLMTTQLSNRHCGCTWVMLLNRQSSPLTLFHDESRMQQLEICTSFVMHNDCTSTNRGHHNLLPVQNRAVINLILCGSQVPQGHDVMERILSFTEFHSCGFVVEPRAKTSESTASESVHVVCMIYVRGRAEGSQNDRCKKCHMCPRRF